MYVLINTKNNLVVMSSVSPIVSDGDAFIGDGHIIYDPSPTVSQVVEMDFPEESYCEYQIQNGVPVRVVPKAPLPVPDKITIKQAKLALLHAGLLDTVNAAIAAIPDTTGQAAQIQWQYSMEIYRDDPLVTQITGGFSLTSSQVDDLFRQAALL